MARDNPRATNGEDDDPLGGLASALAPTLSEAMAVLASQLVTAAGLAMQNIVSQQQTLYTINNAIATKALNILAEQDPAKALDETRKQPPTEVADALQTLSKLIETLKPRDPPAAAAAKK